MFMPHTADCQYNLKNVSEDSPPKMSTIYLPMLVKNYNQIRLFEVNGYKFKKNYKLAAILYNSIKNLSPLVF